MTRPCPYCTYDLGGLADVPRCPECGNIVKAGYLESLMRHHVLREEQTLYWIAMAGWGFHVIVFGLMLLAGAAFLGLIGFIFSILLMVLTLVLMERSRQTWPRRFARTRSGLQRDTPRGLLCALVSWLIPMILICGFFAGL